MHTYIRHILKRPVKRISEFPLRLLELPDEVGESNGHLKVLQSLRPLPPIKCAGGKEC
jgi:hypothetical protein